MPPALSVDVPSADGTYALAGTVVTTAATTPSTDTTGVAPAPEPEAAPEPEPAPAPAEDPAPAPPPEPELPPTLGAIKSKADDKGYDVHGHVEHTAYLLGQQVLIPGQAATGGFIQVSPLSYLAYSPLTAMLPVAIQDNKEVLQKKPNLEGEELYRRLAQEYTGSNDYKKLDGDARRAINILTCTDWSLVDKKVRENTINHLLHSPISFGTIGSVEAPISTDVTIDLGYTHTRDKNWTEVEYMDNNVFKITVVSNNNNGSHTGHAMGTAFVEMPAGTTLRQAQEIGNRMIPSKNKNNKLTIDPAARALFEALPRGASPMILFGHLSEAEQNAFFEGRGIETVGKPNPDCNPLDGGILGSAPAPADPAEDETPADGETPPADGEAPPADDGAPVDDQAPPADGEAPPADDGAPVDDQAPPADGEAPPADDGAPADGEAPPADDGAPPADETPADGSPPQTPAPTTSTVPADDPATPEPASDSG